MLCKKGAVAQTSVVGIAVVALKYPLDPLVSSRHQAMGGYTREIYVSYKKHLVLFSGSERFYFPVLWALQEANYKGSLRTK